MGAEVLERLAGNLAEQLRMRMELLRVEIAEEKIRMAQLLVWCAAALFLSGLAIVLAVVWVVAAWWETPHRVTAVVVTTAVAALGAWGAWMAFRRRLTTPSPLFDTSLAELRKDAQSLNPQP